jgi:hypothetical protein
MLRMDIVLRELAEQKRLVEIALENLETAEALLKAASGQKRRGRPSRAMKLAIGKAA